MSGRSLFTLGGVIRPDSLLSCPFCGRAPEYIARASKDTDSGEYHAISCCCGGYSATAHHGAERQGKVVALWNQRAYPSRKPLTDEQITEEFERRLGPLPDSRDEGTYLSALAWFRRGAKLARSCDN